MSLANPLQICEGTERIQKRHTKFSQIPCKFMRERFPCKFVKDVRELSNFSCKSLAILQGNIFPLKFARDLQ